MLDSMADGVVILGAGGEVLRMNDAAEALLPIPREERARPAVERTSPVLLGPEGRPLRFEETPAAHALAGVTVHGARLRLHHPDLGAIWLTASAAPVRAPDGSVTGAVLTISDETAVHALEQERDDLVRMISHDLRTPLSAVFMQAHLIRRVPDDAQRVAERALAIIRTCERMSGMIQDLIETALLEAGQLLLAQVQVDLAAAVPELLDRLRGGLAVERIRTALAPGLPRVSADPAQLERILVNLLSNALKYSPPESEVLLEVAPLGDEIEIAVSDHGVGIAPEDLPHLFARFFRARGARRPEGLGLGLYITRLLAQAHGGNVTAESQLGRGSTFRVRLPRAG